MHKLNTHLNKMTAYLDMIDPTTSFNVKPISLDMLDELNLRIEQRGPFEGVSLKPVLRTLLLTSTHCTACYWGDTILFVNGIQPMWPGVGDYWMFVDKDFGKHFQKAPKTFIRIIQFWMNHLQDYNRLQTPVLKGFKQGLRFAKMAGLREEGIMRKYSVDGKDYHMFAKIKEVR